MQGARTCRVHHGLAGVVTAARKRDPRVRRADNATAVRRALAVIALAAIAEGEPTKPGEGLAAIGRRLGCQMI